MFTPRSNFLAAFLKLFLLNSWDKMQWTSDAVFCSRITLMQKKVLWKKIITIVDRWDQNINTILQHFSSNQKL